MKRRDSIRPDINKQYRGLCNPSTAISTYLFGDELNKEVEELTKSNKLSNKVTTKPRSDYRAEPYRVPHVDEVVLIRLAVEVAEQGHTSLF
jgi:hypothetical protein